MSEERTIAVGKIARARSGDRGSATHIGVVAYERAGYDYLVEQLSAERVQQHFAERGVGRVERYELPRVGALNFVLCDDLTGGASRSLGVDAQGRLLGTALTELELPRPRNLEEMIWGR
jgi:hypothetical protein